MKQNNIKILLMMRSRQFNFNPHLKRLIWKQEKQQKNSVIFNWRISISLRGSN